MKLLLTPHVEQMLKLAVKAQPNLEIGGFAKVELAEKETIILTDLIIPPQQVSGTAVHFDESTFEWLMMELAKQGETMSDWRCWWHSHSHMEAFCSARDDDTLTNLTSIFKDNWAIALVTNVKGQYYCEVEAQAKPWPLKVTAIPVQQVEQTPPELSARVEEMMKHVTKANYGSMPILGGTKSQPLPLRHDAPYSSVIVWCDHHMTWNDMCPVPHDVPRSAACPHQPNCGGAGCHSKAQRKLMKQDRRATIRALEKIEEDWDEEFGGDWSILEEEDEKE